MTRLYLSTDAGAPSLNGTGQDKGPNLLKAVLVDGYGAQPGAGWTLQFDEIAVNDTAVFRNGTHSLQVVGNGDYGCDVEPFENMVSAFTGTSGKWNGVSQAWNFGNTANSTAAGNEVRWAIVADANGFIYLSRDGATNNVVSQFMFTDLDVGAGTHDGMLISGADNTGSFGSQFDNFGSFNGFSDDIRVYEDHTLPAIAPQAQPHLFDTNQDLGSADIGYPVPFSGGLLAGEIWIRTAGDFPVGKIRGLLEPYGVFSSGGYPGNVAVPGLGADIAVWSPTSGDFNGKRLALVTGTGVGSTKVAYLLVADN